MLLHFAEFSLKQNMQVLLKQRNCLLVERLWNIVNCKLESKLSLIKRDGAKFGDHF